MGEADAVTARQAGDRSVIPVFPLGTVLVPGLVLPLHIFEPRYRALMHDLDDRPAHERGFGVVAIREGHEVRRTKRGRRRQAVEKLGYRHPER